MASHFLLIAVIICCSISMGMGGSAGGKTLGSSGGSASSSEVEVEVMPAAGTSTTATPAAGNGNSALLPKEFLSLPPLGSMFGFGGCSSRDCVVCLFQSIGSMGSCLTRGLTCVHPENMVHCFVAKFFIIDKCFDDTTAEMTGGAELPPPPPPPRPAAGGTTTTTALVDLATSSSCSQKCTQCLIHKLRSCVVAAAACVNLSQLPSCVAEHNGAFRECFRT